MRSKSETVYGNKALDKDIILLDTSTMRYPYRFESFINNYGDILREKNKKIIILPDVCCELAKALDSDDKKKVNDAMRALELLEKNQDIFTIINTHMIEDDLNKAFADQTIFEIMSHNRRAYTQLLISNDQDLCADIYNLNKLQFSHGKKIWTCYINYGGSLQSCDCIEKQQLDLESPSNTEEKVQSKIIDFNTNKKDSNKKAEKIKSSKKKTKTAPKNDSRNEDHDELVNWACSLGGAAVGFCLGKYGKLILSRLTMLI